jgi:hypothetical protein
LAGNAPVNFIAALPTDRHAPNGHSPRKSQAAGVNRPAPIDSTYIDSTYGEAAWAPIHSTYGEAP